MARRSGTLSTVLVAVVVGVVAWLLYSRFAQTDHRLDFRISDFGPLFFGTGVSFVDPDPITGIGIPHRPVSDIPTSEDLGLGPTALPPTTSGWL